MYKLFSNKFIVFILLFLLIITISSFTFATDNAPADYLRYVDNNGVLHVFPNFIDITGFTPYVLYLSQGKYYLALPDYSDGWNSSDAIQLHANGYGKRLVAYNPKISGYKGEHDFWNIYTLDDNNVWGNRKFTNIYSHSSDIEFLYSTLPIYNNGSYAENDFFFQVNKYTITFSEEVEKIPEVVEGVLKMILPVGLTVFGSLLLILVIASRKWLKM